MLLSQKFEEKTWKSSFLTRLYFKTELYRYLWQTSVRIILDCINLFLDSHCIVSQEDFQNKILNW